MRDCTTKSPRKVIQMNEKELQQHLISLVTSTVQEVLNQTLDAEADEQFGAVRYERSADRQDYRSGSYTRKLQTKTGEVELNIPKLREQRFQTAIIEHYRRRESSIEEALREAQVDDRACVRGDKGFRQFLLRGIGAVQGEWNLVCIGYNLKKMYALRG